MKRYCIMILFIFLLPVLLVAQGNISGYMFGDYYYVIKNHDENLASQNGFWFRRIYFTYDYKFSEKFSTRMRLELNSPGDFKTKGKMVPFIKDAYLSYSFSNKNALFGVQPTPTWEFIEKFWGYRSIEKTPGDLYKFGHSRDFGIGFKGSFTENFSYHLLIANGEGVSSEINKGKKVYLSLLFHKKFFFVEMYADFGKENNNMDNWIYQIFLGIKKENYNLGFQYFKAGREQGDNLKSLNFNVFSAFCNFNLSKTSTLLLRMDKMADPNPYIANQSYIPFNTDHPFWFYLIGMDIKVHKNISIIPNLEYVRYEKNSNVKQDNDLYFKLTLFYSWP